MNLELKQSKSTLDRSTGFWSRAARVIQVPTLFGIIPVAFLVVALQLTEASGPQWLGSNFENNYMYLFNSLLIADGKPAHQLRVLRENGLRIASQFVLEEGDEWIWRSLERRKPATSQFTGVFPLPSIHLDPYRMLRNFFARVLALEGTTEKSSSTT